MGVLQRHQGMDESQRGWTAAPWAQAGLAAEWWKEEEKWGWGAYPVAAGNSLGSSDSWKLSYYPLYSSCNSEVLASGYVGNEVDYREGTREDEWGKYLLPNRADNTPENPLQWRPSRNTQGAFSFSSPSLGTSFCPGYPVGLEVWWEKANVSKVKFPAALRRRLSK